MSERDALREAGAAVRRELGLPDWQGSELAPGFSRLADEVCFGRLWARPGLGLEDRMLATLAALTSRQYLPQLATYTSAALHIGLSARTIQEVMIHCAIYSGLPSAENSLVVVADVLSAKNIEIPDLGLPEVDLDELDRMGKHVMHTLHRDRAQGGYASPSSTLTADLYATAIEYGYGAIWNRPSLSWRQRMICTVAAFTAIEANVQARKFFRSALNMDLTRNEVVEVIMQTGPYSGFPRALNALMIAGEVLD